MRIDGSAAPLNRICLGMSLILLGLSMNALAQETAASAPSTVNSEPKRDLKVEEALLKQYYRDDVSAVFDEVVSVQRRAKKKAGRFLLYPAYSVDFSDTPYTMWSPVLNLGYASGEFVELYFSYVPAFNNTERFISKEVRKLTLETGETAQVAIEKAKSQMGVEMNWAPIYGKDSWGPYRIIRSDTFINLGAYKIQYETQSGNKFKLGVGKTFFLSSWVNLRVVGALSYIQYATPSGLSGNTVGLFEAGLVFYL